MDTKASADIHLAMDWLRLPYNYKYQALEALDRAILELRRDEKAPPGLGNPALERLIPSPTDESSLTKHHCRGCDQPTWHHHLS